VLNVYRVHSFQIGQYYRCRHLKNPPTIFPKYKTKRNKPLYFTYSYIFFPGSISAGNTVGYTMLIVYTLGRASARGGGTTSVYTPSVILVKFNWKPITEVINEET
jgi:hypothetical protein